MISVEAGNSRGLPSPTVLEALEGTTVLRTDLHGWVELTSDGEHLWVEVERDLEDKVGENKQDQNPRSKKQP
jgi:beta-lactamase superfamily II metal-dependent hydrolase